MTNLAGAAPVIPNGCVSLPDLESADPLGRLRLCADVLHHGGARALARPLHQVADVRVGPLEDRLDRAVREVAHPAAHAVLLGQPAARLTEEDALHATRAAVEEGVVPGGGVALIRSSCALDMLRASVDEKVGIGIVKKAVEAPAWWIATNAGWEGSVVVDKIKNNKGPFGFNASSEEFEDLMKAGIMDPTKVVRSALQNAASVASLLLTTECMVAEKPEGKGVGGMPDGMPPDGLL